MKWPDLGPGDWRRRRELSYLRPIAWALHGVLAEKSRSPDQVYVWHVVMPLTVPADAVDLSWSERIGGGTKTYAVGSTEADAALINAAEEARKLHGRRPILVDALADGDNVLMQEARAYGLVVSGEVAQARELIRAVADYQPSYGWEHEMIERAQTVQHLLSTGEATSALELIESWRERSLKNLRLDA